MGWLGVCTLALVALPRHSAASGLSESEWWGQVMGATGIGLLNSFLLLDSLKVLAFFVTGPYLLHKLPERSRRIVRSGLRPIHKPLAAIL